MSFNAGDAIQQWVQQSSELIERALITLAHRNLFTLLKAGNEGWAHPTSELIERVLMLLAHRNFFTAFKTGVSEQCISPIFEVNRTMLIVITHRPSVDL